MKFVILTDTHLVPAGETLFALDPAARLGQAIDVINRDHTDIAFIMITGDLAHWGQEAAYRTLADVISKANAPVKLMMGNHDRRELFANVFPSATRADSGFVQWTETFDAFTMVVLDTLDEDGATHAGLLCERRLGFLEAALANAPVDRPLLLFQHHPPFDTGLPSMDAIKLQDGAAEWAVIGRTRKPDYMFMGHIHRPISGHWHGIPFHIQRAIAHGVDLDFESPKIPGTHEAPDYSLVTVTDETIVIHQRSFTYDGPRYWLSDPIAQRAATTSELEH